MLTKTRSVRLIRNTNEKANRAKGRISSVCGLGDFTSSIHRLKSVLNFALQPSINISISTLQCVCTDYVLLWLTESEVGIKTTNAFVTFWWHLNGDDQNVTVAGVTTVL